MTTAQPEPALLASHLGRCLLRSLGKRQFANGSGVALVDWAVDALVGGWDSPSLRILAGLEKPPNEFEVDHFVARLAHELGIALPDRKGLTDQYALAIARDIVDGVTPPYDGARELRLLCISMHDMNNLSAWNGFEDQFELARDYAIGDVGTVEREIVNEARHMLGEEE